MRIFENCIYDHNSLLNLVNKKHTCVFLKQCVRRISLRPIYLNDVKKGIFENLRSNLKKYDTSLNGILLGYQNVKTMQNANTGKIVGRYGEFEVSISVEFFVFQPDIGFLLEGVVNFKSNSHIGCLIHKYFNAIILKPENVEFNKWNCKDIEINDKIIFEVIDRDFSGSVPYIKGKIPDESAGKEENQMRRKTKNSSSSLQLSLQNKNENEDDDFISEIISNIGNSFKKSDDKNSSKISLIEKLTSETDKMSGTAVHVAEKMNNSNTDETTLKVKKKKFLNEEVGPQKLGNAPDNATSSSVLTLQETNHSHIDTRCSSEGEFEIHKTKKKKRKKSKDEIRESNKIRESNHDFGDFILPAKKKKTKKKSDKEGKRSLEKCCETSTEENNFLFERLSRTLEKSPKKKNTSKVNNSFVNPTETLDFIPATQVTPSKINPSLEELACTKTLNAVTGVKVREDSESDGFDSGKKEKRKKKKSPHKKTESTTEINAELNTSVSNKRGISDETENPLTLYFSGERNHKSPRKSDADKKLTSNKSQDENTKRKKEVTSIKGLNNDSDPPPSKKLKFEDAALAKSFASSYNTSEECLFFDAEKSLNISVDVNSDKIININKTGKSTKESDSEVKKHSGSKNFNEGSKKFSDEFWKTAEDMEKYDVEKDKVKKTKKVQKRLENFALFKAWVGIENRRILTPDKTEVADGNSETRVMDSTNGAKPSIADRADTEKDCHVKSVSAQDTSTGVLGKSPKKRKTSSKRKSIESEKPEKSSEFLIDELIHWKKLNMERDMDLTPLKTSTPKAGTAGDESKNKSRQRNGATSDTSCKPKGKEVDSASESSEYNFLLNRLIREKMISMEMDVDCLDNLSVRKSKDVKIPKTKSSKAK